MEMQADCTKKQAKTGTKTRLQRFGLHKANSTAKSNAQGYAGNTFPPFVFKMHSARSGEFYVLIPLPPAVH